jgi:hypothetical protein
MSPSELVTNAKMLERLGVRTVPALRAAFEEALGRASKSKTNTLKTTKAVEAVADEGLREKLRATQEKQVKAAGQIDGDWLVLADKSGSMERAIDVSRLVASSLAAFVKGKVRLVFFDDGPRHYDVSGKGFDEIAALTRNIRAGGGTSIGCGLAWAIENAVNVDGIAIVSDAQENCAPAFTSALVLYEKAFGKRPPVYLYRVSGGASSPYDRDLAESMARIDEPLSEFDLRGKDVDAYSIPNLVKTMGTKRYGLVERIMETPLLTLADVLQPTRDALAPATA